MIYAHQVDSCESEERIDKHIAPIFKRHCLNDTKELFSYIADLSEKMIEDNKEMLGKNKFNIEITEVSYRLYLLSELYHSAVYFYLSKMTDDDFGIIEFFEFEHKNQMTKIKQIIVEKKRNKGDKEH